MQPARLILGIDGRRRRRQQNFAARMLFQPFVQRKQIRPRDDLDSLPLTGAGDRFQIFRTARIPEGVGLAVEEDKRVLVRVAAEAEGLDGFPDLATVNYGQLREWSPSDCQRFVSEPVVDQLVYIQNRDRIGTSLPAAGKPDDQTLLIDAGGAQAGIAGRHILRIVHWWNGLFSQSELKLGGIEGGAGGVEPEGFLLDWILSSP